ncbi:phytanoyl-CoA dioxygenase family protein [Paenibacillus spongiae]|uniref:Phytanoyl-CoA dioxygenase family protein n=1 Tax=Paenibacillus spongiae TaxID=2909671 RepID=A0ABY5S378_9BACL|nr:phytanoyl-CoA dioxygenase family protein [Paenibacillus spongiae]UVI28346.1 phytanoyl-CoA dioxygenase family protein [Paenibacillus spongiae]
MKDLLYQQVEAFNRDGYYIMKGVLEPDRIKRLIDAVVEISEDVQTREISDIIDKHDIFTPLLVQQQVFDLIRALMGPKVQMESVNATRVKPGKGMPVGWHLDSHPYPEPLPPQWYFPISINCAYYLDDLTMEKGPLLVLPGSHKSGKVPPHYTMDMLPGQAEVMAEAGDCVIFSGQLWHAALPNLHPTEERRALYFNYQQSFCKQRPQNFIGDRCQYLREHGPFYIQQLLGKFDGWQEIPEYAEEELAEVRQTV